MNTKIKNTIIPGKRTEETRKPTGEKPFPVTPPTSQNVDRSV